MLNSDWQTFLQGQGAQFQDGVAQNFGAPAAERSAALDSTILCDLSQFGILKVSGDEAQSFLQNLCSNDINAITPHLAQLSSLNTAKGRVFATFLIWQTGTEYFIQIPSALLATVQKKLMMYVLRSKVKIEDISAQVVCLGVSGAEADELVKEHLWPISLHPMSVTQCAHSAEEQAHFTLIRLDHHRFQICSTAEQAPALWQKLSAHAKPVGSPCWDDLNIRAGIPVILPATQEQFVLQMINLDLIGGVNFKKGCYPGQEIVARMQYLGKLKQRTYLAHIAGETAPQPNDPLFSDDYAGQVSGNIVNAAPAPQGGFDVLAALHVSSVSGGHSVRWNTPEGAALNIQTLPYAFPSESGG